MKRLTILFTTDQYIPTVNGIVSHIVILKEELQRRGHRVIIVSPKLKKQKKEKDVYYLPAFPLKFRAKDQFTIPFDSKIEKKILSVPIDIVHNHLFLTGYFGMRIAEKKQIPIIATFHTFLRQYVDWIAPWAKSITHPVANLVGRDYFKEHALILAPSIKAREELHKMRIKTPLQLLHNGIDLSLFQKAHAIDFAKKFYIDTQRPLVIITGILEQGKNVALAIRSIQKLKKTMPNIQLVIIGDGKKRKQLESLIYKLGLARNVFITGFLNRKLIASANKAANVVLFTSDTDNFPTVIIEALASGKPIVAVKDKAVTELIEHGQNGFLAAKNPTSIAAALEKIITDTRLAKEFGKVSFQKSKHLSIISYVNKLERIYEQILQKKDIIKL